RRNPDRGLGRRVQGLYRREAGDLCRYDAVRGQGYARGGRASAHPRGGGEGGNTAEAEELRQSRQGGRHPHVNATATNRRAAGCDRPSSSSSSGSYMRQGGSYHDGGQAGQPPPVVALRQALVAAGFTPLPLFGKKPPAIGKNGAKKGLNSWQHLEAVTS